MTPFPFYFLYIILFLIILSILTDSGNTQKTAVLSDTPKKHSNPIYVQLTRFRFYDRISLELNSKDDEGNQAFRDDFRELPVAARRYKAGKQLLPELVL